VKRNLLRRNLVQRLGRAATLSSVLALAGSFAGCAKPNATTTPLAELRDQGPALRDPELAGKWLFYELFSQGGDARKAIAARKKLDALGPGGMYAHLARGMDDALHGQVRQVSDHFFRAAQAARESHDPKAPLVAWFALEQAKRYRFDSEGLYERWKPFILSALERPGQLGWRARAILVDYWSDEAYSRGEPNVEQRMTREFGCVEHAQLAGPFGRNARLDALRTFAAESPGPWPQRFVPEAGRREVPRVLESARSGCAIYADEAVGPGVYYVETYFELDEDGPLILTVDGAFAIWVDDALVLERDVREWGSWVNFGSQLALSKGRHRLVARIGDTSTSIRLLDADGTPAAVSTSIDPGPGYGVSRPKRLPDPNLLGGVVGNGKVVPPKDDITRVLSAFEAFSEGNGDIASVLLAPLLQPAEGASGPALAISAEFATQDPIFDQNQVKDLTRVLEERSLEKDPGLWRPALDLALWEAERGGTAAAVLPVSQLVGRFPDVPEVRLSLAQIYAELGWTPEYVQTVNATLERFPENLDAVHAAIELADERGEEKRADALVSRVLAQDPDSELGFSRALAREDYARALEELKRLGARHPERKDIAERVYDVMVRAGNQRETWKKLEAAIEQNPKDPRAHLNLADAKYAQGERRALVNALVSAIENGTDTGMIEGALDLIEGKTELEPFRMDGQAVIRAYEAKGKHLPGTAARVLDYAAVWVHADASSRMLEHEIVRIQSGEAISQFAEHPRLDGLILRMRVIKKDGQVLEPEVVSGKPTVTMPHLEVGDYIETEHIVSFSGDGEFGQSYIGPHWFFREENIAYARSEFVVVSPHDRPLVIESRNQVPAPEVSSLASFDVRRWRVEESAAAPSEPFSAPMNEFLPSVWIGWGLDLEPKMRKLSDSLANTTPIDPRIRTIALRIVEHARTDAERARMIYRWVLENVEDGQEDDGRRVITSKRGDRWHAFQTLCSALGITVDFAVAKNRLALPPESALSAASEFTEGLMRVQAGRETFWATIANKYTPFGYISANVRGMPAYILNGRELERVTTPSAGQEDGIHYQGKAQLRADGSALVDLTFRFQGRFAMVVRNTVAELSERQLKDFVESRLLGQALRGARLKQFHFEKFDDLDAPLLLTAETEVQSFAQPSGDLLLITPPFQPRLGQLATLPERQTPLIVTEANHQSLNLEIELPKGATVLDKPSPTELADGERSIAVRDELLPGKVRFSRDVVLPAGRVQPSAYPAFVTFTREADNALSSSLRVKVR
jgi:cellulose synthase operon protein C